MAGELPVCGMFEPSATSGPSGLADWPNAGHRTHQQRQLQSEVERMTQLTREAAPRMKAREA